MAGGADSAVACSELVGESGETGGRMSFGGGPIIRTGPEFTKVGLETEVKIPWETFKKLLILGPFSIWCFWAFGWTLWLGVALGKMSLWRWVSYKWWPWMGRWWWMPFALCLLWWASAPTWATIYRYMVETITKQGPMYTPYPSERGRWKPFSKGEAYDEYEAEAETPSAEDQGPYVVKGEMKRGSKTTLYLEFELEDYAAALKWHKFCKAVQGGHNFSYNEAVRQHKLSSGDWKRIYRAFKAQQWVIPSGRRGTPKLKAVGRHWVRIYAETPPVPPPA